jgi:dimethylamine monooxygenase subunit A
MRDGRLSPSSIVRPDFPEGDHHWLLGVRSVDAVEYFAPSPDRAAAALAERARWLAVDPDRYVQWLPEAAEPIRETCELLEIAATGATPRERLLALGRNYEGDLVWLRPGAGETWNVVGGAVCFPSEWALADKLGRPLAEVHGPVPRLNEQIGRRIDTFLAGFDDRRGWKRMNWSLTADAERNHHPALRRPKLAAQTPPEQICIRWEHQLLLRLPTSGAVLFAIRIELQPLVELKSDIENAARLSRLLETMAPDAAQYKGVTAVRDRLVAYLRAAV